MAAAALTSCRIHEFSSLETLLGEQVTVLYHVDLDGPTVPQQARVLAQSASSPDDILPVRRDTFAQNLSLEGVLHEDLAINVFSIRMTQRKPGPEGRRVYLATVLYKNPSLTDEGPPDLDRHPLERDEQFWTETLIVPRERELGRNVKDILWGWPTDAADREPAKRTAGFRGPVTNAAGFRYGQVETYQDELPIFVRKLNVLNPFSWIFINDEFKSTRNNKTWDVFGQGESISEGRAAYMGIRPSRAKYWGQIRYYELQIRVLYNPLGHNVFVRNEGDKAWFLDTVDPENPIWRLQAGFANGIPLQPPFLINAEGTQRFDQAGVADFVEFEDLETNDYDQLNGDLV